MLLAPPRRSYQPNAGTIAASIDARQHEIRRELAAQGRWGQGLEMQTLADLAAIPAGSIVRIHLLRHPNRGVVAALRELGVAPRNRGGAASVGSSVRRRWRTSDASPRMQSLTRWIYVDAHDRRPSPRKGDGMGVTEYKTPGGPAAYVTPRAALDGVAFEAHGQDGFGMAWHTVGDVASTLRAALAVFGVPGPDDLGQVLTHEGARRMPSRAIVEALGQLAESAAAVQIEINDVSLTWSAAERVPGDNLISVGAELFDASRLEALLAATGGQLMRDDAHAIIAAGQSVTKQYLR